MRNFLVIALLATLAGGAQADIAAAGAQSGSASEAGAVSGASSANVLTITNPEQPSVITHRQEGTSTIKTAPAITITGPASGPCTGLSGGFGASWLGGGIGANLATVDKGCQLRESARMMAMTLPAIGAEDQAEVRAMLLETLRAMYSATVMADEPRPKQ